MKRLDETPIDPELADWLEAIDAALAGEPASPRFADSVELALLLAADRPHPGDAFAAELDARVERRFAPTPAQAGPRWWRRGRPRRYLIAGLASVCASAGIVAVVVGPALHSSGPATDTRSVASPAPAVKSAAGSTAASPSTHSTPAAGTQSTPAAGTAPGTSSPQPPPNGRKVIQSSQIDLGVAPDRIDAVAQEVFDAVGAVNGIVDHSTVTQTGGLDGYASFSLRLPSASVAQALNRLSSLANAQVTSRTDSSQDVNDRYVAATKALSEAQALRTALLKQLANATTTSDIESLKAQIHDADVSIGSDQAAVNRLNGQINYTQVTVTITARAASVPVQPAASGFTLGHAAHVAGRVLVVAAGVALIALAVLVPVGLLVALLAWLYVVARRRRREHALDAA